MERSRIWIRRLFERFFPERHVFVRTPDGEITGRVLTSRKQILMAAGAVVLGGWCLLSTAGVVWGAVATYASRVGGHLVLSRFERVHPRVEAGLNAVPAAVLSTLFAPALISAGPAEYAALLVAAVVALRGNFMAMFLAGAAVLIGGRYLLG